MLDILKKEPVLAAVTFIAAVSAFFVPPSLQYLGYIDWRTLCLLLSLMFVVDGFAGCGLFAVMTEGLLRRAHTLRGIVIALWGLCFLSSMLVTNDIALITFVPFAAAALSAAGEDRVTVSVIVLQTVAANLGSMLTPLGSPQNLYIYSASGMSLLQFLSVMLIPWGVSALLLLAASMLFGSEPLTISQQEHAPARVSVRPMLVYLLLFGVCLLSILRLIPAWASLLVVAAAVFFIDRRALLRADYKLLATFFMFFVFVGNVKAVPQLSALLSSVIEGNEFALGVVLSQIISNVPATLLMFEFTDNVKALLYGVDIGGLGTLVASMASLISYRYYAALRGCGTGRYLLAFTAVNLAFLAVLCPVCLMLL